MKEYASAVLLSAALSFSLAFSLSAGEPVPPAPAPEVKAPDVKAPEPAKEAAKDPKPATPAPKPPEAPVQADAQPPQPQPQPQPDQPQVDIKPRTDTAVAMRLLDDLSSSDAGVVETSLKSIVKPLEAPAAKDEASFKFLVKTFKDYDSAEKEPKEKASKKLIASIKEVRANAQQLQIEPRLLTIVENVAGPKPQDVDLSIAILINALNETLKATEIKAVIDDLASPEANVVAAANKRLLEYGADGVDLLIGALGDERVPVKDAAAEMLKTLGNEMIKESASSIAYYLDNDDKHTRRLASKLLEGLGPDAAGAVDDLINYLDNDDKSVRRVAANVLKKIGPAVKDNADDLVQLLSNDDKNTRSLATEVLIGLGANAKETANDLAGLIDDAQGNDADTRQRCAKVLAAIGPDAKETLETLKKYTADPDVMVKSMVELAIKKIEGGAGEVKEVAPPEEKEAVKDEKKDERAEKKDEKKEEKAEVKKEEKVEVKKEERPEEKKQ
jgi:HEAT repeat protein